MKTIQTCLWFDNQAEQAAKFYTSLFADSKLGRAIRYEKAGSQMSQQPEGTVMTVEFSLGGVPFLGLNGGPMFKLNPSVSFFVACQSEAEIEKLWKGLNQETRMPLAKYPWAEKYGWCEDKFGINWQLMLTDRKDAQKVTPALLFANGKFGQAGTAIESYVSLFPNSKVEYLARDEKTNAISHARVTLNGSQFVLMEGPLEPKFDFSEAVSFMLFCETQAEIDKYWTALSAVPEAEACGWVKDRFGVSWQILTADWGEMMAAASPEKQDRLMKALFEMKKPDIKKLRSL